MSVVVVSSEQCLEHIAAPDHPERPSRLQAVSQGIATADLGSDLVTLEAVPATAAQLRGIHTAEHVALLVQLHRLGGGQIDGDTAMSPGSYGASLRAAGAGITAVDALVAGQGDVALCAVRPPGHHATPSRPMGFCLLNNVAVTANALSERGSRVAIIDIDAHHGNGTHDAFYERSDVLFISIHQSPLYPGTGPAHERGAGVGVGSTMNVPVPPRTSGDDYRRLLEDLVTPAVEQFAPDWLLISAGFDAHRNDPLTELGLTSADYADLVVGLCALVPPARTVLFLEGGYDLPALQHCVTDSLLALSGSPKRSETATGSASRDAVDVLLEGFAEREEP